MNNREILDKAVRMAEESLSPLSFEWFMIAINEIKEVRSDLDTENNEGTQCVRKKSNNMDLISVKDRLPMIDEPVFIIFGEDYQMPYQRFETGRRVMTNDTDWTWYGFAMNTMHLDVTHWAPLPRLA